ncbi:hypothetical protein FALBO_6031 [Fusarium albosuccineum]|uniref:Hydrophobin n=1 Tax=Fusarium albosuccineum TaxID=1237068 RepID=A0A8H4LCG0_9HYPO|nr:hypothetical protein FALBO_6031 [Fusarium albosuccineum]
MKVATILALPALAIAAATPQIEERDSVIPVNPLPCLQAITGIATCTGGAPVTLSLALVIATGALDCVSDTVNSVRSCLNLPPLPV